MIFCELNLYDFSMPQVPVHIIHFVSKSHSTQCQFPWRYGDLECHRECCRLLNDGGQVGNMSMCHLYVLTCERVNRKATNHKPYSMVQWQDCRPECREAWGLEFNPRLGRILVVRFLYKLGQHLFHQGNRGLSWT